MARGVQLEQVILKLQAAIRSSSNTSRGIDFYETLRECIRRHHETVNDEYDWPYMNLAKTQARVELAAGSRYYDFPEDLSVEHIKRVWHKLAADESWTLVEQGIGPKEYSEFDSDEDEREERVLKWDFVTDENGELQFEVWPMPINNDGVIWFEGKKKLNPLVNDQARLDHDDILVYLRAAAELLASNKKSDAEIKAVAAKTRKEDLMRLYASQVPAAVGTGSYAPINRTRTRVLVARSEMGGG